MGLMGLSTEIIARLIDLSAEREVYITSERQLEPAFEPIASRAARRHSPRPVLCKHARWRLPHIAAEAACMGTRRCSTVFHGIQGYINDLEKHGLLRGVKPPNAELLLKTIGESAATTQLKQVYRERRTKLCKRR
jgi:hypothetical protein